MRNREIEREQKREGKRERKEGKGREEDIKRMRST